MGYALTAAARGFRLWRWRPLRIRTAEPFRSPATPGGSALELWTDSETTREFLVHVAHPADSPAGSSHLPLMGEPFPGHPDRLALSRTVLSRESATCWKVAVVYGPKAAVKRTHPPRRCGSSPWRASIMYGLGISRIAKETRSRTTPSTLPFRDL